MLAYVASIYGPLEAISNTIGSLQDRFISLEMAYNVLDTDPKITDAPGALPASDIRGAVTFEGVHTIRFQDDHEPPVATSDWKAGQAVEIGPRTVRVPSSVREDVVDIYIGLFKPRRNDRRANLPDGEERNERLAAYTKAMAEVATSHDVGFVDLFAPTLGLFQLSNERLTLNGSLAV